MHTRLHMHRLIDGKCHDTWSRICNKQCITHKGCSRDSVCCSNQKGLVLLLMLVSSDVPLQPLKTLYRSCQGSMHRPATLFLTQVPTCLGPFNSLPGSALARGSVCSYSSSLHLSHCLTQQCFVGLSCRSFRRMAAGPLCWRLWSLYRLRWCPPPLPGKPSPYAG